MVWATRNGMRSFAINAKVVHKDPDPHTWQHHEACAWAAAWLSVRGRQMIGPRKLLLYPERWKGQVVWVEAFQFRRRGHTPDLAGRIPGDDRSWFPIEVELSHKSRARLNATLMLHSDRILARQNPAVIYICSTPHLAERVLEAGSRAGISPEDGTLRVELLDTIKQETLDARGGTAVKDWGTAATQTTA